MAGSVQVYYLEEMPMADEGPFRKEERELINVVAERLGKTIEHHVMNETIKKYIPIRKKTHERYKKLPPYPAIIVGRFARLNGLRIRIAEATYTLPINQCLLPLNLIQI